ncbi:MAG: cytochrome-c peroxidase [Rhodobacteraceae bacterium]|nr:cytochrome-c peroxidase [Paracoccaceae bacterium]
MKSALFAFALCFGATGAHAEMPHPVTDADYGETDPTQVKLGQLLFWDPILSGNKNISCGTCHHPNFGTGDGLALGIGEGGIGLGPERRVDPANLPEQRIPRHSPALFNLGAHEFTVLFHDGRIETDPSRPSGLRTPLGEDMVQGFSGVLSAQTMFPVLSADEMAGHYSENDVSQAVRRGLITGEGGAWDIITQRVWALQEYRDLLIEGFPEIADGEPADFTHISDAIAAFIAFEWRSDESAFDSYLRDRTPLPAAAEAGRLLFYGEAGCATCHSGVFQTDHGFHAMGTAQIGPGKAARFETHARDDGRMRVTGRAEDAFAFRTPSLRNVTHTAPYGHAGAHAKLSDFLRAHVDAAAGLAVLERDDIDLPDLASAKDWRILDDATEVQAILAAAPAPNELSAAQIDELIAFLDALSDSAALEGRLGIPDAVPSGLPIDR